MFEERTWHHGHSYYTTPDCDNVQFACLDCGRELTIDTHNHCWGCMAKFCVNCWGFDGMTHEGKHHVRYSVPAE